MIFFTLVCLYGSSGYVTSEHPSYIEARQEQMESETKATKIYPKCTITEGYKDLDAVPETEEEEIE